jgi:tetratricopeptide (TPR) repeat protein
MIEDHRLHSNLNYIPQGKNYNIMHQMAYFGNTECFKAYAQLFFVNKVTFNSRYSVVWIALRSRHWEFAVCAIKHGARVNKLDLEKAEKMHPGIVKEMRKMLCNEGLKRSQQLDYLKAEELFTHALKVDPYYVPLIKVKALCLEKLGRYYEAQSEMVAARLIEEEQLYHSDLNIFHDATMFSIYDEEIKRISQDHTPNKKYYLDRLHGNGNLFGMTLDTQHPIPTFMLQGSTFDIISSIEFSHIENNERNERGKYMNGPTEMERRASIFFQKACEYFKRGDRIQAMRHVREAIRIDRKQKQRYKPLLFSIMNPLIQIPYSRLHSSGGFGSVTKVWPNFIVKAIEDSNSSIAFAREVEYLRKCEKHKNIIKYRGHYIVKGDDYCWRFIIMDQVPWSLSSMLKSKNFPFTKSILKCVIQGLLCGLVHIHKQNLVHCDIKLSNIGINGNIISPDDVKILDFGGACVRGEKPHGYTKRYSCPEICSRSDTDYDVDLFGVGFVLYKCLSELASRESGNWTTGPNPIVAVISKACELKQQERYQSAEDMLKDFNSAWSDDCMCFEPLEVTTAEFAKPQNSYDEWASTTIPSEAPYDPNTLPVVKISNQMTNMSPDMFAT